MEALIVAVIIAYAVKKAAESAHLHWQGAKAASRRGTRGQALRRRAASAVRHDAGYWAHQVLNGFPQIRGGLADGWHAGRTAQQQGRARRQQSRTEHLEERARLIPELREHRRRQDEALEKIRAARQPEPQAVPPSRRVDGKPETDADRRFFDAREGGYEGWIDPGGYPVPGPPGPAWEASWPGTVTNGTTPTEGTPMSDVTYDTLLQRTADAVAAAEERAALMAAEKRRDDQTADQMQALEVDVATLSAMADYLGTLDQAEKAQQAVTEAARNVEATLKRGHAGLSEAHKDAPVTAADREFYQD